MRLSRGWRAATSVPIRCPLPILLFLFSNACGVLATACTYTGGWSLRVESSSCPPSAPIPCGAGLQTRCCPAGLVCAGDGDYVGNYCCPDGQDCQTKASQDPQCGNPKWTLWGVGGKVDEGGWCCLSGYSGAYQNNTPTGRSFGVGCYVNASTLVTDLAAASVVPTTACTPSAPSVPSPSISAGGIAGAVVGAVGGVAVLVVGFYLVWKRRRRMSKPTAGEGSPMKLASGHGAGRHQGYAELPIDSQRAEAPACTPLSRHELGSECPAYELDSGVVKCGIRE